MKNLLLIPLLLIPLVTSCSSANGKSLSGTKPNIILVMADDQGWGDCGYNGHPFVKTPNLDAMAAVSMQMNRFYSGAPVCSPTRASVMTGRTPIRSKVLNHGHYMRYQEETIAEGMKRAGYVTGHFGKWHIGSVQPKSPVNPGAAGFDEWISAPNYYDIDPYLSKNGKAQQFKGESSELTASWTVDFIKRKAHGDKPFFAVTWFSAPHWPHKVLPADQKMYADKKEGSYFQEITVMDRNVGRIRKALRDEGIEKKTLVWYCSDNGGLVKESSGGREKKGSIYEGGLRVPSLVEWPGTILPGKTDLPMTTSDMLPTLMNIAGVKPLSGHPLDGINVTAVLEGGTVERKSGLGFWHNFAGGQSTYSDRIVKQIMEAQKAGKEPAIPERIKKEIDEFKQYSLTSFPGHAAWQKWPWKLHRIEKKGKINFELYNLEKDPMEANNVIDPEKEKAAMLKAGMKKWQISVINSLNGKDYK